MSTKNLKDRTYYENLDKRTKEYKQWKANFDKENSIGAGDVVEKITKATGIKKVVEWIAGEDCGCDERKEKLNEIRFHIKECPSQNDFEYMKWFLEERPNSGVINGREQDRLNAILTKVTGLKHERKSCCYATRLEQIKKLYDAYR